MSYVVAHKTGKVIQVSGKYKAIGFSHHCPVCDSSDTYFSTMFEGGLVGWLCMDCGVAFLPEEG